MPDPRVDNDNNNPNVTMSPQSTDQAAIGSVPNLYTASGEDRDGIRMPYMSLNLRINPGIWKLYAWTLCMLFTLRTYGQHKAVIGRVYYVQMNIMYIYAITKSCWRYRRNICFTESKPSPSCEKVIWIVLPPGATWELYWRRSALNELVTVEPDVFINVNRG